MVTSILLSATTFDKSRLYLLYSYTCNKSVESYDSWPSQILETHSESQLSAFFNHYDLRDSGK